MLRMLFAFLAFLAVSACAGTLFAQAVTAEAVAAEAKTPDSLGCLNKCAAQGVFCASEVSFPTACESIAECKDTHIFKDALAAFCTACITGESSCTDALPPITVKPQPAAKPVEGGIQKAGRIKRLTTEYMCAMSGGVMLEVFVGFDPKKQEVALRQECRKSGPFLDAVLQRAADKLSERPSAVKAVVKDQAKPESEYEYEEEPAVATPPAGPNPKDWEQAQPNVFGPDQGDALANLAKAQEKQAAAQKELAKALEELNKMEFDKPGFAAQLNFAGSLHVLRPYSQKLHTVGGELVLLPVLDHTWRLRLGLGAGYSGQDRDGDYLGMVAPQLGLEKRFGDIVYLGFGALAEIRVDDTGTKEFDSYGVQVAPQFCFGGTGKVCFGPNAALEVVRFSGPETGEKFVRPDLGLGFTLGVRLGR